MRKGKDQRKEGEKEPRIRWASRIPSFCARIARQVFDKLCDGLPIPWLIPSIICKQGHVTFVAVAWRSLCTHCGSRLRTQRTCRISPSLGVLISGSLLSIALSYVREGLPRRFARLAARAIVRLVTWRYSSLSSIVEKKGR